MVHGKFASAAEMQVAPDAPMPSACTLYVVLNSGPVTSLMPPVPSCAAPLQSAAAGSGPAIGVPSVAALPHCVMTSCPAGRPAPSTVAVSPSARLSLGVTVTVPAAPAGAASARPAAPSPRSSAVAPAAARRARWWRIEFLDNSDLLVATTQHGRAPA